MVKSSQPGLLELKEFLSKPVDLVGDLRTLCLLLQTICLLSTKMNMLELHPRIVKVLD